MLVASFIAVIMSSSSIQAQQQPILPVNSNPLNEDFAKYARSIIDHFHVPGLSISVVHNGKIHSDGYGTAVFPNVPAKADTMYFVGSTTKSFTAAALTLLMDDKSKSSEAFHWNTTVSSLIRDDFVLTDDYINKHVTLEDLASHRTGFPRHDLSYGTKGLRTVRDTVRNMRLLPFTAGFREKYMYCNYTWATLGYLVDIISQIPLGDFLRSRIWKPLGMDSTYLTLKDAQAAEQTDGKHLARGYTWDERTQDYYEDPYLDIGPIAGAGSMISNVEDYAKYLEMMLERSKPLSEEAHIQLRRARIVDVADIEAPYGGVQTYALGWDIAPYRGINIISHDGGLFGFGALMAYVPELKFGVTMFANTAATSNYAERTLMFKLLDDILQVPKHERHDWLKQYDDSTEKQLTKLKNTRSTAFGATPPEKPLPMSQPFDAYEGDYWSDGYKGLTFKISKPNSRIPLLSNKTESVLRASVMDRVWPGYIELEHITGEYFVAWLVTPKGKPEDNVESIRDGFAAEFKIGADGQPSELGIALEEDMKDEKIWFRRV